MSLLNKKDTDASDPDHLVPIGPVVLTEEEREEAQRFIDSVCRREGGAYYAPKEVVDVIQRGFIATTLEARADRFKMMADSAHPSATERSDLIDKALSSSAKASAICPEEPLYLYRFARLLEQAGKADKARIIFQEYLRRQKAVPPAGPNSKELIDSAVEYAKTKVSD